jgi:hypothetical protein
MLMADQEQYIGFSGLQLTVPNMSATNQVLLCYLTEMLVLGVICSTNETSTAIRINNQLVTKWQLKTKLPADRPASITTHKVKQLTDSAPS